MTGQRNDERQNALRTDAGNTWLIKKFQFAALSTRIGSSLKR